MSPHELQHRLAGLGAGPEFEMGFAEPPSAMQRREFLRLMAASLAMSAGAGCSRPPPENIVPTTHDQTAFVPGVPRYYATSVTRAGYAMGVLVRSDDGRPTKIEGNPDHPASLGATDAITQAELLTLYDPARSTGVRRNQTISDWDAFAAELQGRLSTLAARRGEGLHIILAPTTSPTALDLISRARERFPRAAWYRHDPLGSDAAVAGAQMASGRPLEPVLALDQADAIVVLDSDLFGAGPAGVRCIHDFSAARRSGRAGGATGPALLVAEPVPTCTGARADHRLAARRGRIGTIIRALSFALGSPGASGPDPQVLSENERAWVGRAAAAFRPNGSRGLVVVGHAQPPEVHALGIAINAGIGALGRGVRFIDPVDGLLAFAQSLDQCTTALEAGAVDTLLALDVNPAYDSPRGLSFGAALVRAPFSVHLGLNRNETSLACNWHAPLAHDLESWGDARAFDGTAGVIQPLTEPFYGGRSLLWLLGLLSGSRALSDRELVEAYWRGHVEAADWDSWWRSTLKSGVVAGSSSPQVPVRTPPASPEAPRVPRDTEIEAVVSPDSRLFDGRYANNAWLHELPDPITQLTWENAALIGPALALRLGVETGDVLRLGSGTGEIELPALVVPGVADNTVGLTLGYGRTTASSVGQARGTDVTALRGGSSRWTIADMRITRGHGKRTLALAQLHEDMQGRDIVRVQRTHPPPANPDPAQGPATLHLPLYRPTAPSSAQQWGMSIDLAACVGCGACVVACQAENNVPVVGPEELKRGRRMHWLRVDRYFDAAPDSRDTSEILFQPLACVHCEQAPCELVCPTGATQHSSDGLNEMNYARCIGTRYCSNNCPYKVRRFNFFRYSDDSPAAQRMHNPRVTTRGRGVMEKCTYCVQRIRSAEFDSRISNSLIPDGAVIPACQQACPAQAIVFGDVNDPSSRVSAAKRDTRSYALLGELNTVPRTTYLADIRPARAEAAE
jgi:molybdopterin-containing oxidoreductase family iron-sulfur binding subunit